MVQTALGDDVDRCLDQLIASVHESDCTLATAESLTGGQLAAAISAAPEAGDWYRGGIVAYHPEVKHSLLGSPPGPVVTPQTAAAMAHSAARLFGARYTVALTGVGGPVSVEGKPPGTVYIATFEIGHAPVIQHYRFDGDPVKVMERTICAALQALTERIKTK